jgi:hypothetical protein
MNSEAPVELKDTEAAKLVGRIALVEVGVLKLEAEVSRLPHEGEYLTYDERQIRVTWNRTQSVVLAVFDCEIRVRCGADKDSATPLGRFRVVHKVQYRFVDATDYPDDESLRHYIGVIGFMHVWPYYRSEVQAMTAKLGLPALTMGVKVSGSAKDLVLIGPPARKSQGGEPPRPAVEKSKTTRKLKSKRQRTR